MPSPTTPVATPLQTVLARAEKMRRRRARRRRAGAAVVAAAALGAWPLALTFAAASPAATSPGAFTGWAFDACAAPSAHTMDEWLKDKTDPYRGIGIYISGSLRACSQPNLTAAWVSHVQQTGWHLLPLTVGPQASCTGFSQVINDNPANTYAAARKQGAAQADNAVETARALGITPGSTLFYDMENWSTGYNNCDASALWFMSAWTNRLHAYGYAGGTYVSGLSGARLLNAMANDKPSGFVLPDQIWVADWNDQENTNSQYLSPSNWANHQRAHQYWGGHNATNSHITLNIDSNYVDLRPVSPIPAVVPDSAIGAPLPLPAPSASASPSATPTPQPTKSATAKPSPTAKPTTTKTASATPTTSKPTATPTKSTTVSKPSTPTPTAPVSTKPTSKPSAKPTAAASTPAPPPTTTPTTKPVRKPTPKPIQKGLSSTINHVTSQLGSASGIKLPTLPAARALAPKLADRVPTMVVATLEKTQVTHQKVTTARATQPSATPTVAAPTPTPTPAAQAAPLQPSLPYAAPEIAQQPSLIARMWHNTQEVLQTIGQAFAAAAGWAGRGFSSMIGW